MEYANSRIERLKAKVEETDRDFGRLKLRSHSKFNKILQVSGDLRQIEALVEGRDDHFLLGINFDLVSI